VVLPVLAAEIPQQRIRPTLTKIGAPLIVILSHGERGSIGGGWIGRPFIKRGWR